MSDRKWRQITINEAVETQDYSHDEMENLVFIEAEALKQKERVIQEYESALEYYRDVDVDRDVENGTAERVLKKHTKGGGGE